MMTKNPVIGDYKKWLLYTFESQDFQTHYELMKALESGKDFGSIRIAVENNGGKQFAVSHTALQDELVITDDQRRSFIKYLIDYYFQTEDVDAIMVEKRSDHEKQVNHHVNLRPENRLDRSVAYRVPVHPKEKMYYRLMLVISLMVYAGIVAYILLAASFSLLSAVTIGIVTGLAAFFYWLLTLFAQGVFVGIIRGSSIRVTKDQYPELYLIIEEQARILGVEKLPDVYITSGHFNAFVTRFARRNLLMIYSDVVETSLKGDYEVLKYVTAHELCHIRRKHLNKRALLFPARLVPFLGLAYSRACEYTCDRVGFDFSQKGAIEGVLVMTVGKNIHSRFNVERHLEDVNYSAGFWTWLSEKFLTHPHLYNRLLEMKRYSERISG